MAFILNPDARRILTVGRSTIAFLTYKTSLFKILSENMPKLMISLKFKMYLQYISKVSSTLSYALFAIAFPDFKINT